MSRLSQLAPYLIQRSTPSAVAALDFVIPTDKNYRSVILTGWLVPATDNVEIWVRLSNDGGVTFRAGASDYAWATDHNQLVGGSSVGTSRDDADSEMSFSTGIGNAAGEGIAFEMTVVDPLSSARKTTVLFSCMVFNTSGQPVKSEAGGVVIVAAEVNDAVRLMFSSGNIATGEVTMFGLV